MRQIIDFLECNFATPMNTPGMGNPSAPEGSQVGSGDVPFINSKTIKKKKKKRLREFLNNKLKSLNIIFELDEESFDILLENNRTVFTSKDGDELQIGDHANQRQNRPIDKGGDGERITQKEIINMFIWSWDNIVEMNYEGDFNDIYDKNNNKVKSFTIECQCYLEEDEFGDIVYKGARPDDKKLWAAFMIEEDGTKLNIIIKTIFRGETFKHIKQQEKIKIWRNGNIQQIDKR